jgi:hypothetical protein
MTAMPDYDAVDFKRVMDINVLGIFNVLQVPAVPASSLSPPRSDNTPHLPTLILQNCPTDALPAELKPKKLSKYDINAHRATEQKDVTEEMAITLAAVLGAHRCVEHWAAVLAQFFR